MREKLIKATNYSFDVQIVADYGEDLYIFDLHCQSDPNGLHFSVITPETIAGLSGHISDIGGKLVFDEQALGFPMLAEGQITPVSAPWVFIKTLKGGYIRACSKIKEGYLLCIDDSYAEGALQVDIIADANLCPMQADILWQGRRVLTLTISNYQLL